MSPPSHPPTLPLTLTLTCLDQVLHLHRVMTYESKNRMGRQQLAVCWAPTLLLGDGVGGGGMQDTGLMVRVVETILGNATAIFDED